NQFILDLPFTDQSSPQYVAGFGNYGSFNSAEGLDLRVPIPTGDLNLPLDNGLRTSAQWYTADVGLDLTDKWHLQNTGQFMQDQLQLRRTFGRSTASFGLYFANYTQDNHWFFTQILTDVGDQTHFLDAVVTPPGGTPDSVTKNGFVNQLAGYTNGSGQTSLIS